MAENNTNRPLGLNMPSVPGGRRSNLRLAFPNQARSPPNDRPQNNLDFPASGYPTSEMDNSHAPPSIFSRFMAPKAESSRGGGASGTRGRSCGTEEHLYNSAERSGNTSTNRIGSAAANVSTSSLNSSMPRPSSLTSSMRPSSLTSAMRPGSGSLKFPNQQNGQQISSQPRERQKKQLVLVLPPPHNNHQNSSRDHSNHNPHHQNHNHHHHQHNRNLFHPDTFRDRSHKSAMNDTSNESPPSQSQSQSARNDTSNESPRRERVSRGMYQSIQSSGKLQITPELQVEFTADDLTDLGEIGRGGFGTVNKMVHRKSNTIMAVKRIRSTVDEKEQKQLLMDLEVVMRSNDCPCIVQFYGAIFKEGDCWICMELMDTSLDKFYKFIYERLSERLPENILGKITVATLTALNYLKEKLKIIHRDVKPSNILLDKRGNIKLCDFGISGQLVDSIAKTRDAGCRPYMAPERIDPARARGYDVRSDVWSLGITLMELATGSFPYPKWNSVFEQLTQVVQGEPPRLSNNENGNTFSEEFVCFVNTCLIKEESSRPKYRMLLEHEFVTRSKADPVDVADFVSGIMDKMANNGRNIYTYDSYNC